MSTHSASTAVSVPSQPPPVPPRASEATRLLCAGTYLNATYRDRVIEELYLNEQRIAPPALGHDAARVLAHALRARRLELTWAAAIVALWIVGLVATGLLLIWYLLPEVLLALAGVVRGTAERPAPLRRFVALVLRWLGRFLFLVALFSTLLIVVLAQMIGLDGQIEPVQVWLALVVLLAVAVCNAGQRGQFARVMGAELAPERFPDIGSDPAESAEGSRFRRLMDRIRLEQHAPLIMYHEAHPFCGAGTAHDTWVLAVELRPEEGGAEDGSSTNGSTKGSAAGSAAGSAVGSAAGALGNRIVLDTIEPLLAALRVPAKHAGDAGRDRLRRLEIDECVFLPAEGLRRRADAPFGAEDFERHRSRAVEEGAEKRRHFLRVRVGGWEEELVVTVFVRVHTQGRMLMLEIAPHVLQPIRADFKDADRAAHRFRSVNAVAKAAWAVGQAPGSAVRSLVTLARGAAHGWAALTGGHGVALPEGPAVSVRELGAAATGSLFQQMDVDRYLKSIQDRIAEGVKAALAAHGYRTGEFVQKVVNISNGAVHIGSVRDSTFAVGDRAEAHSTTGNMMKKGPGGDGDDGR
ncbi:hypothetical protein AB0O01_12275 [Streptomyces sp. NPDC093252]|uniref:hypothetical protein n=1 Tax=Streptomyces sp. NPDC093252 TaxID=3154980 RepID=UPI0034347ED6